MAKPRRLVLAKASHPRTNRRGRLVPLRGIRIRVQFPQTRRSARSFQAPRTRLRLEAAYGGSVLAGRKGCASHRHRSGLKIPPRPLSAPVTPLASMARQPHRRARRAALINAVSPHQFSPFGNPLSRSPLQTRTRQRGKTAGGNSAASPPARLKKPPGPSPPAEPRHAALRVVSPTPPLIPLAPLPPGAGRSVGQGRARSSHLPSPPRCSQAHPAKRLRLSPLAPYHPQWGWAHWFCCGAPASRGRAPAKQCRGVPLHPLGDARVVRRPAIPQASVLINSIAAISGNNPHSPLCHRPTEAIMPSTSLPQDQPHHRHE